MTQGTQASTLLRLRFEQVWPSLIAVLNHTRRSLNWISNLTKGGHHEDAFISRLVSHSKSSSRVDCFPSGPICPLASALGGSFGETQ